MKVEKDKDQSPTRIAIAERRRLAKERRKPQTRPNGIIVRPLTKEHFKPELFATLQNQALSVPPSEIPRQSASALLQRFYSLNRHALSPISATLARVKSFSESCVHPTRWHIVYYGRYLVTIVKSDKDQHQCQLRYRDSDNQLHWLATATLSLPSTSFWKQDTLLARFKRIIQRRSFYMAAHSQNDKIPL